MSQTDNRMRVALVQLASTPDRAENLRRLAEVAVPAADLVVLPEVFQRELGPSRGPVGADAVTLDGPFVRALVDRAERSGGTWVAGMLERADDPDRPYNTVVAVDASGVLASYRKIHLYDSFGFRESDRLLAGPRTPAFMDLGGMRIGLMTCYDLRFPELARELSRVAADALVVPSAWVAGPRKLRHWQTLVTSRAIENVAYVVAVGQPAPRYTGHSLLVDPRGDVVVEAGDGDGDVVAGDVESALVAEAREENPSLSNRRDDEPWPAATDARVTPARG